MDAGLEIIYSDCLLQVNPQKVQFNPSGVGHSTQSRENGLSLPRGNCSVEQMDLDCSAQFQLLWERFKIRDKCKLMMLQNSTDFNSVYSSLGTFYKYCSCSSWH